MVADGADAADALGDLGHLKIGTTFAEFLQPPEFVHVEEGLFHLALFIQMDRDPPVAFDARDRFDGYLSERSLDLLFSS